MATSNVPLQVAAQKGIEAIRAGNMEEARRWAQEYRRTYSSLQRSRANIAKEQESYAPQAGQSALRSGWEGFGATLPNVGRNVLRLALPKSLETPVVQAVGLAREGQSARDAAKEQEAIDARMSGAGVAGKLAGEFGVTAPLAAGVLAPLRGAKALRAARELANNRAIEAAARPSFARQGLANAAEGALGAELTTDDQAGTGAAMGAVAAPIIGGLGKTLRILGQGLPRTAHADTLLAYGADLTPGKLHPEGWLNRLEATTEYSPILGKGVQEARDVATRPVIQNLASDIAEIPRRVGREPGRAVSRALRSVNRDFGMVDTTPLGPADRASVALGRVERAAAGRTAKEAGEESFRTKITGAGQEEATREAALLEARVASRAAKRKRIPELIQAKKLREGVAGERLAEAQIARASLIQQSGKGPGREAARRAIAEASTPLERELAHDLAQSVKQSGLRVNEPIMDVVREAGAVLRLKNLKPSDLKKAASDLKTRARNIRYGRDQTFKSRNSARILDEAAQWFETRIQKAIAQSGGDVGRYTTANVRRAQLTPLIEASSAAELAGRRAVRGTDLNRALGKSMSKADIIAGKGGPVRNVAKALIEDEMPRQGGLIERNPILRYALGNTLLPVGLAAQSRMLRRVLQGSAGYQRALNRMGQRKAQRMLAQALRARAVIPGVIGAEAGSLADNQQE